MRDSEPIMFTLKESPSGRWTYKAQGKVAATSTDVWKLYLKAERSAKHQAVKQQRNAVIRTITKDQTIKDELITLEAAREYVGFMDGMAERALRSNQVPLAEETK